MRVQPVVAFGYRRVATRDLRLSNGVVIPRGTAVLGSAMASMTHPAIWGPTADSFIPVRTPHLCFYYCVHMRELVCMNACDRV